MPPERYRELAALVGETSDNLPGVPGVGPKTAAKWLTKYGGLDELVAHVDEIKGKAGDNLREHLGDVLRNQQLNKLDTRRRRSTATPAELDDRPVGPRRDPHALRHAAVPGAARAALRHAVRRRARGRGGLRGRDGAARPRRARRVAGRARERRRPRRRRRDRHVGPRHRRHHRRRAGHPGGRAAPTSTRSSCPRTTSGRSPRGSPTPSARRRCTTRRARCWRFAARGMQLDGLTSDTALAAYLALPGQRSFDLGDLALRYLHRELRKEADDERPADPRRLRRAGGRLRPGRARPRRRRPRRGPRRGPGAARRGHACCTTWSCRWCEVLADMERLGIAVDIDYLARAVGDVRRRGQGGARRPRAAPIGREFNLGSPKQIQQILFDELGLPKTQAHQDRLHHRLRGADQPVRPAPATRSWSTCCATARSPS